MTYNDITRHIKMIDEQIKFMYETQKKQNTTAESTQCGNIINSLCAFKNYLKYDKEYDERTTNSMGIGLMVKNYD